MRMFVSAGEPSGDLHGANLIRAIRLRTPNVDFVGFGGQRLADAGSQLLFPLANLSVMGIRRVADQISTFLKLIRQADRSFREQRPDAVVLIDYPGLHWWLAKRAHRLGIPVIYFVPPQLWAWAGWRVRKMRRTVDHVLTTLPFEQEWFASRGVNATYVGHPYFDELQRQPLDQHFVAAQRAKSGPMVAILPGSRNQEVVENIPTFVKAARRIHRACGTARFVVAAFNEKQMGLANVAFAGTNLPVEVFCGRTAEIISLANACMSVSGSVGLELLNRALPSVVHYKINRTARLAASILLKVKWISLVNILANEEILPEFLTTGDASAPVADRIIEWICDEQAHSAVTRRLGELRRRVAAPGACDRAAEYILNVTRPGAYARPRAA